jgi:hypothetical protein
MMMITKRDERIREFYHPTPLLEAMRNLGSRHPNNTLMMESGCTLI